MKSCRSLLEVWKEKNLEEIKHTNFLAVIADETSDSFLICSEEQIRGQIFEFSNPVSPWFPKFGFLHLQELHQLQINEHHYKLIDQIYDGALELAGSSQGIQAIINKFIWKLCIFIGVLIKLKW